MQPAATVEDALPHPPNGRGFIYLNNAAEGWPKAPGVAEAVLRAIADPPVCSGRMAGQALDPAVECRKRIAGLLAVPHPDRIVLTANATHALNLAIHGLGLREQALVITTVTEHNSVLRPLFLLERLGRARMIVIGTGSDGSLDASEFERALGQRPALVAISHASNVTGRINPIANWFAKAKEVGATTLLDASQTVGHIPVQPQKLTADLVAFPGHKGLHGPSGTGALYVAPSIELQQFMVGGTGRHSQSRSHPAEMPGRLEAGTPNSAGAAGLAAALAWHESHGQDFGRQAQSAGRQLRRGLRSIQEVRIVDDRPDVEYLNLVSFYVHGWEVEETGLALRESFGIACRTGLHCAPLMHQALGCMAQGTVRLSASGFNSEAEIDTALDALALLAK
jgi:cysteine desulfurase / selenocysteine lyase